MRIDIHQHIWTGPLLQQLRARRTPPLIRDRDGLTLLLTDVEQPYAIDVATETAERRAELVRRDGESQLLYGSDRPVIQPKATGRDERLQVNIGSLFDTYAVAA